MRLSERDGDVAIGLQADRTAHGGGAFLHRKSRFRQTLIAPLASICSWLSAADAL